MKDIGHLRKEKDEKVHSFTQIFSVYLKNFSAVDRPSDKVLIEYYTSALGPELAMFSKMKVKPTLVETYEEAERVETESESVEDYPDSLEDKITMGRISLLSKPRGDQPHDYQGMMKMLQKLSNRIIDLERERDIQKTFKPHYLKREDNNQWQVPPPNLESINITEVGGDDFCTFHQQPHSEKKCPQWLHSMTLVMNKLLDPKLAKDSGKEEKEKQIIREPADDTMFSWNGISLFDTEDDTPKFECTSTTTKDMGVIGQDNAMISKINKLQENVKRLDEGKTHKNNTLNQRTEPITETVKLVEEQTGVSGENFDETQELAKDIPIQNQLGKEDQELGWKGNLDTPPFLLTLEMLNYNVHN